MTVTVPNTIAYYTAVFINTVKHFIALTLKIKVVEKTFQSKLYETYLKTISHTHVVQVRLSMHFVDFRFCFWYFQKLTENFQFHLNRFKILKL